MIDFHTHIFPPEIKAGRELWTGKDPCFSQLYTNPKVTIATAEDLLNNMKEAGIEHSVALGIGWNKLELCRTHNDYMIEVRKLHGDLIIPFCSVQPAEGDAAYYEIERCVKNGLSGIGELRPDIQGLIDRDMSCWKPVMEAAKKWDLPVLIHSSEPVGHTYTGKGEVSLQYLYRLICTYGDVKIVLAHWGGGLVFYSLMPEVAKAMVNTYFDTAATNFLYKPEIYKFAIELAGRNKILYGSDFPLISHSQALKYLNSLKLDSEALESISRRNASTFLKLHGTTPNR